MLHVVKELEDFIELITTDKKNTNLSLDVTTSESRKRLRDDVPNMKNVYDNDKRQLLLLKNLFLHFFTHYFQIYAINVINETKSVFSFKDEIEKMTSLFKDLKSETILDGILIEYVKNQLYTLGNIDKGKNISDLIAPDESSETPDEPSEIIKLDLYVEETKNI